MPEEVGSFASIRRRKTPTQLLRPSSNDNCPLFADVTPTNNTAISPSNSKRFIRWTACFGFVSKLKRPKSKLEFPLIEKLELDAPSPPLSIAGPRSPLEPLGILLESDLQEDALAMSTIQRPSKDRPFPLQAATPLSALSPPPRHAMKERSRSMTVDSSTPWPSSSSPLFHKEEHQESLPLPLKQKASTIGPSRALRLSLDIEQQYSSSPSSISDLHKKDEQDDASSCTSSNRVRGAATPDPKFRLSSIEASTPSAGGQQAEKRLSLIERRQRTSATIPDIEKLNIFYNESGLDDHVKHGDEEDGDYEKLLSEFRLPSETLPPSSSPVPVAVKENKEKREEAHHSHTRPPMPFGGIPDRTFREMSRQQAMDALEGKGSGVRPMDVGRDKAYYDAVVAGTLHRRPWTQFLQPQSSSSRDVQGIPGEYHTRVPSDTMLNHHRSSLVYFPPSPNSINSEHGA